MTPHLDLESIRCFERAAHYLNFRQAADELAISPSAFSDRITRLESQLNETLFHRTTRTVELSAAGRRLLPVAQKLMSQAQEVFRVARGEGAQAPFTLTIGTRYELGNSWLVPALTPLNLEEANRHIDLVFGDSDSLISQVLGGNIDAAITSARLTHHGLSTAALHPERYAFVARPQLLKSVEFTKPEHAKSHTLIDVHTELPLFRYFQEVRPPHEEWTFGRREHLGTISAAKFRILEGKGVGVLPLYFVQPELKTRKLRRIFSDTEPLVDMFRLVWKTGHPMTPELRSLGQALATIALK